MKLHYVKFGKPIPNVLGFRLWPFSVALAVWSPRLEDWRIFSIGPDPFV